MVREAGPCYRRQVTWLPSDPPPASVVQSVPSVFSRFLLTEVKVRPALAASVWLKGSNKVMKMDRCYINGKENHHHEYLLCSSHVLIYLFSTQCIMAEYLHVPALFSGLRMCSAQAMGSSFPQGAHMWTGQQTLVNQCMKWFPRQCPQEKESADVA